MGSRPAAERKIGDRTPVCTRPTLQVSIPLLFTPLHHLFCCAAGIQKHVLTLSLELNSGYTAHDREELLGSKQGIHVESICRSEEAVDLLSCLSQFDQTVLTSFTSFDPVNMTTYLFDLSRCVSKALRVLPIKHESDRGCALTRLSLFSCARTVLATGMQILGLQPLRAM